MVAPTVCFFSVNSPLAGPIEKESGRNARESLSMSEIEKTANFTRRLRFSWRAIPSITVVVDFVYPNSMPNSSPNSLRAERSSDTVAKAVKIYGAVCLNFYSVERGIEELPTAEPGRNLVGPA